MVNPQEADSASDRAYRVIRDHILDGTHSTGTMLGESTLASSLGVSRTPVRVALARLQDEGWITVYPKRGALVNGLTERAAVELADARFLLETTSVGRAAPHQRSSLADRLELSIAQQRDAFEREDLRAFIELTLRFHRGFVEACGNDVLLELYDRLSDRHRFLLFAAGDRLRARCNHIIDEHVQLTSLLREGDEAAFADVLRSHIAEVSLGSSVASATVRSDPQRPIE
ncbi:GntR family transcriptional regulator [Rhodococcus sp. BP-252]|uniref:GntR family transcriptional regulator n=1 Tax=unclassified Rhodococcus (in: high G+C Gram-positive bacteria) TaxID=192944 RepID=UPI00142FB4A3|nr:MULTISPECIES: GntR family transcriptional regulator [unclassified Rhodococcus (in: high G+C Gram-positive bacteria)]MBY6414534.1 GntR family transcriptional regulator [Rhodococcus sp. BP-320]MBY6419557.1 GntR family transcriptional regulator [Rhodococcus sp. BP-321]MBY6424201.1 GntR family transcriptional regulator [Rhodococcus sp. BP-324]MBY6429536.1 GntR family transcriptional regulator [Rhodococcus sp. BP-323]MBY6434399.1 GntR family transcriptional regulator [Rhodococcus sp. BP-322]